MTETNTEINTVDQPPIAPPSVQQQGLSFAGLFQNGPTKATEKTAMAEASMEVMIAHQRAIMYPRDVAAKVNVMMQMCANINFAADALYIIENRGEGLTVQTAKDLAQIWGNLRAGIIHHGEYGNESQVETFASDLENNFTFSDTLTVKHQRYTKAGGVVDLVNPDDIINAVKLKASKSVRNCILSVLPNWLEDSVKRWCKQTMQKEVGPVDKAWDAAKLKFKSEYGIDPFELMKWADVKENKPANVTAAHIVELRLLLKSLKEDTSLTDKLFPTRDKTKTPQIAPPKTDKKPGQASTPAKDQTAQSSSAAPVDTPQTYAPASSSTNAAIAKPDTDTGTGAPIEAEKQQSSTSDKADPKPAEDVKQSSTTVPTSDTETSASNASSTKTTEPEASEIQSTDTSPSQLSLTPPPIEKEAKPGPKKKQSAELEF